MQRSRLLYIDDRSYYFEAFFCNFINDFFNHRITTPTEGRVREREKSSQASGRWAIELQRDTHHFRPRVSKIRGVD